MQVYATLRELKHFQYRIRTYDSLPNLHLRCSYVSQRCPGTGGEKYRVHLNTFRKATIRSLHGWQRISAQRSSTGFLFLIGRATWRERDPRLAPPALASNVA